jgi:hypothetical protein
MSEIIPIWAKLSGPQPSRVIYLFGGGSRDNGIEGGRGR